MRARVTHTFTYRYSDPVLLGPHRFCLRPRPHGFQRLIDFGFLLFFLMMSFFRTLTHYMTLRYRVSEGRLELVEGLFFRQHRLIDPARIQNMEVIRNIFHRMAGLAELRIDTAGEGGAEGLLSAISIAEANQLRAELARMDRLIYGRPAAAPAAAPGLRVSGEYGGRRR
jgi:putative membrane protein